LVSWINDRLPEMIWAALLTAGLGRDAALSEFRQFLRFVFRHPEKQLLFDATLTGLHIHKRATHVLDIAMQCVIKVWIFLSLLRGQANRSAFWQSATPTRQDFLAPSITTALGYEGYVRLPGLA
jgi:hypothetical protein